MSKQQQHETRWPWLVFVFGGAVIGACVGNAQAGGFYGVGVMLGWAVHQHQQIQRRQHQAAADENDDAEEATA